MKHRDALFSKEENSPDGSLHICYNYSEGEKTPTIIEPCVTVVATGEVLFDFWRTRLNGSMGDFSAKGFRLTVSDNYGVTTIVVRVDVGTKTFTLVNDSAAPRPLSVMSDALFWMIDRARNERTSASGSSEPPRLSLLSRLARWLK
jgi:hypothetical protein